MARRIEDAIALGKSRIFTETGTPAAGKPRASYDNMLRFGFRPTYERANYLF